ncbi:ribosomal protein S18-alanine N-acetyltransferase [uncultured Vibrio sp.]|uniref:ribosomal protein S18-alanine N-acetyltransferase n=1 Tax=uncultured Vibrio sp. TaxID=114054 RepID=UPI000916F528|nr:ribosomal protein S18-alanine N-acetyltransferase [uncultured Vibrio sp.]OIQ23099.1 MAG: ribosomal-protein-alanine N-acetyltransferase [Vibrio sp. MedPE-SWchi]
MTHEIVPMSEAHLASIITIEKSVHSHPWSESLIKDVNSRGACHHVMLVNEEVVGYFYAQNIVGEVTLLNIAVSSKEQGKGYGKRLTEYFLEMCEKANAESAWLEVRESNKKAYQLYESVGFNELDRRVNYYPTDKGKEDAIIMSYIFF